MSPEVVLGAGYAGFLVAAAVVIEWLSAHTHRRALRYRTAGFSYDARQDHWQCPEGQHLWPHEFDIDRRLVRYRAKAHICTRCPRKDACTDSDQGREIGAAARSLAALGGGALPSRPVARADSALAARAGRGGRAAPRAHRGGAAARRRRGPSLATGRWLLRDLRAHPANTSPTPTAAQGLRMAAADAGGRRARSRWASQHRTEEDA